jgi:DnaK suppressor protein
MFENDLKQLRELLLKNRWDIFQRLQRLESGWKVLQERDIEMEEEAQKSHLTTLYDQLDRLEIEQIEAIDLALYKMQIGKFGICEGCRKPISPERLQALPETRLCRKCARNFEARQEKLPGFQEILARHAEVPAEYRNWSDREITEVILEKIAADGRIDRQELHVISRKGIVYLEGLLPSEAQHQILLRILTDTMGFSALVDHLAVSQLLWEREEIASGQKDFAPSVDAEDITEDVYESLEEGKPFMFPEHPPSEKE